MSVAEDVFRIAWKRCMPNEPAPEGQYRFHATRKWLFDFAWPDLMVAIEIQGAGRRGGKGGHQTHTGMQNDCDKNNAAVLDGWTLLYFRAGDRNNVLTWCGVVRSVLHAAKGKASLQSGK